jgi:hypothetical protein
LRGARHNCAAGALPGAVDEAELLMAASAASLISSAGTLERIALDGARELLAEARSRPSS